VLCDRLGIPLGYKDIVFQGTQAEVLLDEHPERVGFYNTFVGRVGTAPLPAGVSADADPDTGDVHLVRGPHFRGIQFHAESILTEHGAGLVTGLVDDLLAEAPR
jgi:phenazine biosynthesis protein phzE